MSYILNPTENQLKEWYSCKERIAKFLMYKCHLPLVARKGDYYYFVKTEQWKLAIAKLPLWDKIVEKF